MDINLEGISELFIAFLGWFGKIQWKDLNTEIIPQLSNYIRPIIAYFLGFLG